MRKVLLGFVLTLFVFQVNAAPVRSIMMAGGVVPFGETDTHLKVVQREATVITGTGDFAFLAAGAISNIATVANDIPLQEGTTEAGKVLLNDFMSFDFSSSGLSLTEHDISFRINEITDVAFGTNTVLVDMILTASGTGFENTDVGFRWEASHNSLTGSFSASSPIPPVDTTIIPTPIPAAVWLFGSALMGLVGVSRRKSTG